MSTEKYNGWTNRETWLVNLWLTNESDTDAACRELVRVGPLYQAADQLQTWTADEYLANGPTTGLAADLVTGALARVNWVEIAEHFREV